MYGVDFSGCQIEYSFDMNGFGLVSPVVYLVGIPFDMIDYAKCFIISSFDVATPVRRRLIAFRVRISPGGFSHGSFCDGAAAMHLTAGTYDKSAIILAVSQFTEAKRWIFNKEYTDRRTAILYIIYRKPYDILVFGRQYIHDRANIYSAMLGIYGIFQPAGLGNHSIFKFRRLAVDAYDRIFFINCQKTPWKIHKSNGVSKTAGYI